VQLKRKHEIHFFKLIRNQNLMWTLLRSLLFLLPAELTHELAKFGMKWMSRVLFLHPIALPNPIGLAAGFDKNCEILEFLPALGFGSAEIGTVTPRAQAGNPKPRLFRDSKNKNLFNRMGFNNWGSLEIAKRLREVKPKLPANFIVGVNLGKNKDTPDENAANDYALVAKDFLDTADYFVINVSSPNTPGLRALQTPEKLTSIVEAVKVECEKSSKKIPLWVKLAPELTGETLKAIVLALQSARIDGFVLTNTVAGGFSHRGIEHTGGYSGKILTVTAFERLKEVKSYTSLPVISVGGIFDAKDVHERLKAGASAVQIYTGWVYGGPFLIRKLVRAWKKDQRA
jgi:dihydroorotate dehydrogenase